MFCAVVHTLKWAFLKELLKCHLCPAKATPSIVMDALDLTVNVHGVGWNWSKYVYVPLETRPASSHTVFSFYVLLTLLARALICGILHTAV